ncbi:MAG: hypothetical protein WAM60_24135, partial [Candidatus Promineifilaceae bacterium]
MGRIEEALRRAKAQRRGVFEPEEPVTTPDHHAPALRFPRAASEGKAQRASHVSAKHVTKFNN